MSFLGRHRFAAALAAVLCTGLLLATAARAWWPYGHWTVAQAAARALPEDMPEFFRKAGSSLSFYSDDPDLWTDKSLPLSLRPTQSPEHFIDLDRLEGNKLPPSREEYAALCRRLKLYPDRNGWLPYAVRDWHDRLTLAFAEHRKWLHDERVKAKALYFGGVLSHYAADAAQPLHATVHFDGRVGEDGRSPRSGIHLRMDALPEQVGIKIDEVVKDLKVPELSDAFAAALAAIEESGARVQKVYDLEGALPPANGPVPEKVDPAVRELALGRCRSAARLTAGLWYSAWQASAKVKLPEWHRISEDK